jgi:hypothetical protein
MYNNIMEKFLEKKYFFNNPITLQKNLIKNEEVYITSKLDGRRYLIYIHPNGCFLINTVLEKEPADIKYSEPFKAVLDVEFYKNKYYIFDILSYQNRDVRYLSFLERLNRINKVKNLLPSNKFIVKDFKKINVTAICDYVKSLKFKLGYSDGVIINSNEDYYHKIYKYKPPEMLSIDFRIKKERPNVCNLYVDKPKGEPVLFTSTTFTPYQYKKYKNNTIVEFGYDFKNKKFIPFRERPDKLKSNGMTTVKSNYKEILTPSFKCE